MGCPVDHVNKRTVCPQCNRIERNAEEHPIHVPRRLPRPETSPERTHREDTEEIVSAIDTKTECNPWVENMSSTALREAQLEDPVIGELIKLKYRHKGKPLWEEISRWGCKLKEYWSNWELLHFKDGVLYRTWIEKVGGRHRELIVLPERLRNGPLRKLHDDKVAGHFGLIKTYLRIRERYFWVGFKICVENWCRRCPVCVQKNKPSTSTRTPMKVYIVGAPMERVALDILGLLPLSEKGNKYILCAGDYFTTVGLGGCFTQSGGTDNCCSVNWKRVILFLGCQELYTQIKVEISNQFYSMNCVSISILKRPKPHHTGHRVTVLLKGSIVHLWAFWEVTQMRIKQIGMSRYPLSWWHTDHRYKPALVTLRIKWCSEEKWSCL